MSMLASQVHRSFQPSLNHSYSGLDWLAYTVVLYVSNDSQLGLANQVFLLIPSIEYWPWPFKLANICTYIIIIQDWQQGDHKYHWPEESTPSVSIIVFWEIKYTQLLIKYIKVLLNIFIESIHNKSIWGYKYY